MVTDSKPRLFVLDTNVLMHDPTAMFRFDKHDVYLPMVVLEELDAAKKGVSEVARNARQVSRMLDDLIGPADRGEIERGLTLPQPNHQSALSSARGRLFLQTHTLPQDLPMPVPGTKPDHFILAAAIGLQKMHSQRTVVLVSKDINLRIKARMLGVHAEEYHSDQVLEDVDLLYTGVLDLPADSWDQHGKDMSCSQENGRTRYTVRGPLAGLLSESVRVPSKSS